MKRLALTIPVIALFLACQSVQPKGADPKPAPASAQSAQEKPAVTFSDEEIGAAFLNAKVILTMDEIPHSYWVTEVTDQSMYFNLFLIDRSETLTKNTAAKLKIIDKTGRFWDQVPKTYNFRIGNWENNYSTTYSLNGSVISIEKYTIELTTPSGRKFKREYDPVQNMRLDGEGKRFMYSSDYFGKVNAEYLQCLISPKVKKAYLKDDALTIEFTVDDPRVKNGSVGFYTTEKKSVGWSGYFYNGYSEQTVASLNNGNGLKTDGSLNVITLTGANSNLNKDKKISDVGKIAITVYDNEFADFDLYEKDLTLVTSKSETTNVSLE